MNSATNLKALILLLPLPAGVLVELLFLLDEITTDLAIVRATLRRDLYRRN